MKKSFKNKKGITLIALVITIIVLLILAGISISMISSQDAILRKTVESKETMSEAELKEKIELAVIDWKIEKETNSDYDKTLEEFLDEKEEIKSAKIKETLTLTLGDTVITVNDKNNITVGYKSKNLIKNGYLENKNNDNFKEFTYNKDGYLSYTTNELKNFPRYPGAYSNEFIPIDASKKYRASVTAKTDNINSRIWLGIVEFDVDYNVIEDEHFMYVENTLTYLTQDLKKGDTEIHLNDISNFKYTKDTPYYRNGIIVWNYEDGSGHKYGPLTYSRNVYSNIYDYNEELPAVDKENNVIKLKEAWSGDTIKAETKVSQCNAGLAYNYIFYNNQLKDVWKTKSKTYQGTLTDGMGNYTKGFRPGTKYVKFVYYSEIHDASENATVFLKDIVFEEIE